jgi:hypothetical protein
MNLLQYTNGIGHLIMSIFLTIVGLVLVIYPGLPATDSGVGIGIILAVQAAWIVPGAAKQVASEIVKQVASQPSPTPQQPSPTPPAPTATGHGG